MCFLTISLVTSTIETFEYHILKRQMKEEKKQTNQQIYTNQKREFTLTDKNDMTSAAISPSM